MPPLSDTHLLGDPDDLRRILEALDARNEALDNNNAALERVTNLLQTNTEALQEVREQLIERPTTAAVKHSRRRTIVLLVVFGLALMFAQDQHVEHCSPGSRVTHSLDHLLAHPLPPTATPEERQADFERYYNSAPGWCDLSFPLHSHDGSKSPTDNDWLGLLLYALLGGGLYLYQRGPRPPVTPLEAPPAAKDEAVQRDDSSSA